MMTKKQKISLGCLSLLLLAFLAASGFMVYRELSLRQKEKEDFAELLELVQAGQPEAAVPDGTRYPAEKVGTEPARNKRNLVPLFAQNSECIGWLSIPGTGIDYPVMHTPGDPQKYLRRNFYGEYSYSGIPFLDSRCSLDSDNLIIYGHNMKNGTMFGTLKNYMDGEYLKGHPIIEFETGSGCAEYTVFAIVPVDRQDGWYYFIDAADGAGYEKQVRQMLGRSLYDTGVQPEYGQQILTLSTCYHAMENRRLLVIAVKRE